MINSGLCGFLLLVVISVCVAVAGFPFKTGNVQYWRRMCDGLEDVPDNSTCMNGVWRNPCGKIACLRGPGEHCDDVRSSFRLGKCADGLFCNQCAKCVGCFRGSCHTDLLCTVPYIKRINNYPVEYFNNYNEY